MTKPVLDYTVLEGSFSVDGAPSVADSFTPSAGELWYVEAVRFHTNDSNGTNANAGAFIVDASSTNFDLGNVNNTNGNGDSLEVGDTTNNQKDIMQANLDTFISDAEKLIIGDTENSSRNITVDYVVAVRRVL